MSSYKIANPYIEGGFKNLFTASTPQEAAKKAWEGLSANFACELPRFGFSLEKLNDGTMSHFVVKEGISQKGGVKYAITQIHPKKDNLKEMLKEVQKKQSGGEEKHGDKHDKHKKREHVDDSSSSTSDVDDSSSDDSSDFDSEIYRRLKYKRLKNKVSPIFTYWWYDPTLYDLGSFYSPVFYSPSFTPYVEIYTTHTTFH